VASEGNVASGLAARYATALFELASERNELDGVAGDLTRLKAIIAESSDLRQALRNPILSRAEQGQALAAVLAKAGASATTQNFVGVIARNRRAFALSAIIDAFLADLARRAGAATAEVTVARALNAEQSAALEATIKQTLGPKVTINLSIDPALLGGMVVQIGSRMIDNSLRTKFDKLQLALKAPGGQI
jgi:F-type H+-transporting ATPase subunit delta